MGFSMQCRRQGGHIFVQTRVEENADEVEDAKDSESAGAAEDAGYPEAAVMYRENGVYRI